MNRRGNLFIVSGPSGAGKGTIIRETLKKNDYFKLSISVTTRDIRKNEKEGIDYFYKSKEEFKKMIDRNEFIEYANVYDNYYGTQRKPVIDAIEKGESVLLEIDIQGALQIKKNYPESIFVFILPPSMTKLKSRIIERNSETDETLKKRFLCAFNEINYIEKYDYYIINDVLEDSINSFRSIIEAEKCRVMEDIKDIIKTYKEEL